MGLSSPTRGARVFRSLALSAPFVLLVVVACGRTYLYGVNTAPTLTGVFVHTFFPSGLPGSSAKFSLFGILSDGSTELLPAPPTQWASSDTSVAAVNTTGQVTFSSQSGNAVITGTDPDSQRSASAPVSILGVGLGSLSVTCPSFTLPVGFFESCRAILSLVTGASVDATDTVTWSIVSGTGASVSSEGQVTGLTAGAVTVKAALGGLSASTPVQVTSEVLGSINLAPQSPIIGIGSTTTFTAMGYFSAGTTLDLTNQGNWSSSTPTVITIGPSTGSALALAVGSAQITFICASVTQSTSVQVISPALSIQFSPTSMTLLPGQEEGFRVLAQYPGGVTGDITTSAALQSTNTAIALAAVGTGVPPGVVIAISTGVTSIAANFSGLSASLPVTVGTTNVSLVSISVSPANATIDQFQQQQFGATANYSDGSTNDITNSCVWAATSSAIVTNSAPKGIATDATAPDSSTITCTYGGISGSANLTVSAASLQSIAVSPSAPSAALASGSLQFGATGTYSDSSQQNLTNQVTWSSTNTSVATISNVGVASLLTSGSTTIKATLGSVNGTTTLTVTGGGLTQTVFISSATYNGNIGSLLQADANCAMLANAAHLGGGPGTAHWKAVLGTMASTALSRINISNDLYNTRPPGAGGPQLVASANTLWGGSLIAAINYDETGTLKASPTWTGTNANGSATGSDCSGWTSSSTNGTNGSPATNSGWVNESTANCSMLLSTYCINGQ